MYVNADKDASASHVFDKCNYFLNCMKVKSDDQRVQGLTIQNPF